MEKEGLPQNEGLLRVCEVARRLAVVEGTVRSWIALGKFPKVTLSPRAIRVPADFVTRFVAARTAPARERT